MSSWTHFAMLDGRGGLIIPCGATWETRKTNDEQTTTKVDEVSCPSCLASPTVLALLIIEQNGNLLHMLAQLTSAIVELKKEIKRECEGPNRCEIHVEGLLGDNQCVLQHGHQGPHHVASRKT